MIKTKASEMVEKLQNLGPVLGEEMTQHPLSGGTMMNFPNNYRGLAKVTKVRDDAAKNWGGVDTVLFIDMESGETNLLTPAGQMATVADISKVFDLETWEPHP